MKKRYQVFICSTFTDLLGERQAAVEAILKAGHIPAGMELFTAGDQSQMDVIRKWIDESDIFMLILGARYGSIEPLSGLSYIEMEFDYARDKGKPFFSIVLTAEGKEAKIRAKGTSVLETQNEEKYRQFRKTVESQLCAFFATAQEVKLAVFETLPKIIDNHPDLVGWIPGSGDADIRALLSKLDAALLENEQLRNQISKLSVQFSAVQQVDLRIQLRKAVADFHNEVASAVSLHQRAVASRRAVSAARGTAQSGVMTQWHQQITQDGKKLFDMKAKAPKIEDQFDRLGIEDLENRIVSVHDLQGQVRNIRQKYETSLQEDEEARRQLAEFNRARLAATVRPVSK